MARPNSKIIRVAPPNLDRTGFLELERHIHAFDDPVRRDWLLDRFDEGLQVRMVRAPERGFIAFCPGRSSWRPINAAEKFIVVQALRLEGQGCDAIREAKELWQTAVQWARYFGFAGVLSCVGSVGGMLSADLAARLRLTVFDQLPGGIALVGSVVQGPVTIPCMPRDWTRRAAFCGEGLVVQTAGASDGLDQLAERLCDHANRAGLKARVRRLSGCEDARQNAVLPDRFFAVVLDGKALPIRAMSERAIWAEIKARM